MNAITAAQRLTPIYNAPPPVQVQAAAQASQPLTSPSTSVSLGQAVDATPDPTYTANGTLANGTLAGPQVRHVWEREGSDKLSIALMNSIQSSSNGGRFQNIGAALLEQLAGNGGKAVSQSIMTIASGEQPNEAALQLQLANLRSHPANGVTFSLTTASGATVNLSLASSAQGLAVSAEVLGGELNDEELQGLAAMAGDFQSALDGLTQVPPRLQLGNLVKFDTTLFSGLQLNAKLDVNGEPQTFDLSVNEQSRNLTLEGPSGRVQMNLDTPDAAKLGSSSQRQAAISNYLSQFDAAQKRGKGDENLMNLFKDAFTQLNAVDDGKQAVTERGSLQSASDRALLSGLADFNASISQTSQQSNPMRLEESDRFDYRASQSTSITGGGQLTRSVQQDQQSALKAGYHLGLNPLTNMQLGLDRESQNYRYHEINDQASSSTRLAFDKGRLVEASASQSASQSERVRTYVNGDLTDDVTTPSSSSRSQSLLTVLDDSFRQERIAREQSGISILDDALQSLRSRWQLQGSTAAIGG